MIHTALHRGRGVVGTLLSLALTLSLISAAAQEKPLPPGGVPTLPQPALSAFRLVGASIADAAVAQVDVSGQPFAQAWRAQTTRQPAHSYDIQLSTPITASVKKGDVLLATFYVRSVASMTGAAQTLFVFERAGEPYTKSAYFPVTAGPRWRRFDVPFTAEETYAAGEAQINFLLGFTPQTIELSGISVVNYGGQVRLDDLPATTFDYEGRAPGAPWRREAARRIDRLRKADLKVRVTDSRGRALSGVVVDIVQRRHAFGFGSAVAAERLLSTEPENRLYQAKVQQLFNKVVMENDLKWLNWEENRARAIAGVQWLSDRGIAVRGHNLVWPNWNYLPASLHNLKDSKGRLSAAIDAHILDEVGAMRDKLVEWDVVNEPYANHDLQDVLGNDIMAHWYLEAHQTDPNALMFINDYSILSGGGNDRKHQDGYEQTIRNLQAAGAPVQGIGMQSHFGYDLTPPTKLLEILDRFARLGLPIEATEFDINIRDEKLQADYLRDFMTALFSHPAVNGIVMWGFWEGQHWLPQAALFRKDWTIKPNGQAWIDLVFHRWWTRARARTDGRGRCAVRGFQGDYEITVRAHGRTKTVRVILPKGGNYLTIPL